MGVGIIVPRCIPIGLATRDRRIRVDSCRQPRHSRTHIAYVLLVILELLQIRDCFNYNTLPVSHMTSC